MFRITCLLVIIFFISSTQLNAQQVIDSSFIYNVTNPVYSLNKGPIIFIDEYHNNDMSIDNRMFPLIKVLKEDGYQVKKLKEPISKSSINKADILVIISALHKSNVDNWKLPTPEAFNDLEIRELLQWIKDGGSLLLVADHMPFPGAIKKLSSNLGVEWFNGFVLDSVNWGMSTFSKRDGTLAKHPLVNGRNKNEKVNWIATYYGSGFKLTDSTITGLFSFNNKDEVSYQTQEAWKMDSNTPVIPSDVLFQAAVMKRGKGRVALIGEASLFSAQLVGKDKNPVGINFQNNNQNLQFVLNLLHWLSGAID
ncbi:hypothetical protein MWU50_05255 [Flavobacteriaceae bacterium S0862]|nr:hypothetical protein [Flavobacteriaceae bacterium S0862]